VDEELNVNVTMFFDLLKDFDKLLWDGCTNHSKLLVVAQIFTIKSDYGLSEVVYDKIIKWVIRILPKENRLEKKIYTVKSIMKPLDLKYQKIDMHPNFCILLGINSELTVEGLLLYLENIDPSQSHLDCKGYSCL
jgi:hypothetical protein